MPPSASFASSEFLHGVFDAIPAMLLVVDKDTRIQHCNLTTARGLGLDLAAIRGRRGGEALHCLHATETAAGCGHAPACRDCAIRGAVRLAYEGGRTERKSMALSRVAGESTQDLHLLVTASPLSWDGCDYVLLALEDVSELVQLRSLLPICMFCKRIRDDEGYWSEVTTYLESHLEVDFSHSVCPDCLAANFPELADPRPRKGALAGSPSGCGS